MRKHNGVRLDGGHSALAVLARRAASACMAVATVVGVVGGGTRVGRRIR
ncbi:hypothetical protein [Bifidobacterium animalis]|nr:hypothetical protein [Bifidobacterium animalis]